MYITGENPLLSEPDLHHAEETFKKLELLIVQDIFMHETAEIADVVLPATSFAEKDGTFTNSERRVQRVRKAIDPVGDSRPDWVIIQDVARRVSQKLGLELEHEFDYDHPSEIFDEMRLLSPVPRRNFLRASRNRGRDTVALPHSRPSRYSLPVRKRLPTRPARQVRGVRPGACRGRDSY